MFLVSWKSWHFFKEWASFQENVMTWHVSSLPLLALILSSFTPPFEKALLEGEITQCLSARLSNLIKESCILQIVQNQSWVNLVDIFHIVGRYPWNEAFWYALLLNVQTIKINCFWFNVKMLSNLSYAINIPLNNAGVDWFKQKLVIKPKVNYILGKTSVL